MRLREDQIAILSGGVFGAVVIAFVVWIVAVSVREQREFMAECQQHQPKYQCTALWKASQPDTVVVHQTGR